MRDLWLSVMGGIKEDIDTERKEQMLLQVKTEQTHLVGGRVAPRESGSSKEFIKNAFRTRAPSSVLDYDFGLRGRWHSGTKGLAWRLKIT